MNALLTNTNKPLGRRRASGHFTEVARARVTLTTRQFAERYVRLPRTSPFGNVPFRCDRQPIVGLLFDEMDHGDWRTFLVSGPSQSGKTLSTFVIPTLRDVVELRLNTIIGFPEADMASDKWDTDFRPTFESSPDLKWLLPKAGPGSRGGRVRDRITLENGVDLKIMTRGGQDTGKAGFTSPRVRVTEAAGWSKRSEGSVEANPLRQLKARMKAFSRKDRRRCLFVEGTLTVPTELPWNGRGEDDDEVFVSSRSRILSPCPHCGDWVSPGREHLVGWQDAKSEDEAANRAAWLCPSCAHPITIEERKAMLTAARLVHAWQQINEAGEIVDLFELERRPTSTLWFHWSAWHNLLRDPADFAVAEWEAAQIEEDTQERENAEMELCQFDFSTPYRPSSEQGKLEASSLKNRKGEWPRNVVPADTQKLVMGVDVGKWRLHWVVLALREGGQVHVVAYGTWDVCQNESDDVETRIFQAIAELDEQIVKPGFVVEGSGEYWVPDKVVADGRFFGDHLAAAMRAIGQRGWKSRWKLATGIGRSTEKNKAGFRPKIRRSQQFPWIGVQWYAGMNFDYRLPVVSFNADYWKVWVHDRIRARVGRKGALTAFAAQNQNEHGKFWSHLVSEQLVRVLDPKLGFIEEWQKNGQNHWLDATAMGAVAGDICEWRLREIIGQATNGAGENVRNCAQNGEAGAGENVHHGAQIDPPNCENPKENWYAELLARA